ncbi:MAG: wax ester/triacylglycerol synthase family O-acyltransferase [Actinomycetota bacterium]
MERMSGIDASFLYFETPNMHMHVVAAIVFDPSTVPGGYSFDHVKEMIRSRLHLAKPLRRKLVPTPLNLDHPVWVEDNDFDLDYHVRRIGCPSPGSEEQLSEIVGDIASRPLDRTRPLWEVWIVEGLENGYTAAVAKMHHCTIDGVSGANFMVHFFDLEPQGTERPGVDADWKPDRRPTDLELLGRALIARAQRPLNWVRVVPATLKSVGGFIAARRRTEGPGMPTPLRAPRTSFNATITPHRRTAFTHVPLDDVKAIKREFGTTVNDVVLAIVAGALRRYLESRDEMPDRSLLAAVPVSVRTGEEEGDVGSNRVSAMFSTLATDVDDPVERLKQIAEANRGAKEEHKAIGADMLTKWGELAAPLTFSLAARFYTGLKLADRHAVVHNLVISNVPGPAFPLYFAGAKLVAMYPLGPIFDGAGLNITVLSYMDQLYFGLIGCREIVDVWGIAGHITESFAELSKAAQAHA